jgi:hypothetical protein
MNAVDSPYLADVLIQVPALQEAVSRFDPQPIEKIANGIKERRCTPPGYTWPATICLCCG